MNELRLSVSKVKTFLSCKAKYKYVYIDKLPRKEWDFFTLGKFCHKVLEDFHLEYINGSSEKFNKVMTDCFKKAVGEFAISKEMKKECWNIINQYLKVVYKNKKFNVIACEKNFEFSVGENIILNGMIDRIQIDDDNVINVCDYKTTKNTKTLEEDFFQLLTYAYAIYLEDPEIDKVRGSYILLRHDFRSITQEFDKKQILSVKDIFLNYGNQILSETEYAANPNDFNCNFCDYQNVCPSYIERNPLMKYGEVNW